MDKEDVTSVLIFIAWTVGLIAVVGAANYGSGLKLREKEAVKAGFAKYVAKDDGEVVFVWNSTIKVD